MIWKRVVINLLIGLFVGALIVAANTYLPMFKTIELGLYNTRIESFRGTRTASDDIIILAMDEASFGEMGPYPWTRDIHAQLLDKLVKLGARLVAFDIMFQNPSNFPEADQLLKNALIRHKDKTAIVSKFDYGSTSRISGSGADNGEDLVEGSSYSTPYFEDVANFGFANYPNDSDGQIRKGSIMEDMKKEQLLPSAMTMDGQYEPSFAFKLLSLTEPKKASALKDQYRDQLLWINFAGPPTHHRTLSFYIPYKLGQAGFGDDYFTQLVGQRPDAYFKDKIVLIGATAEVLHDNENTPFVSWGDTKMPGVEIHANMLETLRENNPYQPVADWINPTAILGLAILIAILLAFLKPLGGIALCLTAGLLYSVGNIYLFQFHNLFMDWFAPIFSILLVFTATYAYRFLVEEREKRRIRRFFKSYVSPQLVEELLKDPSTMPSLKSERRMVTVLFSDIAGFTSMSESLPPDEVEHILNEYLTAMSEIVFESEGTLDKYIGDAVMAIWGNIGVSNPKTDAYKAVNTAIQMQKRLIELREKWLSEGMVPLQIRIGLNTGEALVGNFGSPQKMDYTVIGDAVNTAARLEGLNKEFGTSIIISQSTYDLVQDRLNGRHCGTVKVKGKEEAVSVYEVQGWKEEGAAATEIRDTKWVSGSNETQWK